MLTYKLRTRHGTMHIDGRALQLILPLVMQMPSGAYCILRGRHRSVMYRLYDLHDHRAKRERESRMEAR